MKEYIPKEWQPLITQYVMDNPKCAVWASMGSGKTAAILMAVDMLLICDRIAPPILVVAPLRVAQSVWPDELTTWACFKDLTFSVITGDAKNRSAMLKRRADIYTINYENLHWLEKQLKGKWPFEMVIIDEGTRLKGFRITQGTKRVRVLAKYAHNKIKRLVELTGTPAPNGLKDLWGQAWFLDAGKRLGRSFDAFRQRWFQRTFDGYGMEPLPFAQKQIEEAMKDICISIDVKDYMDIKEPIVNIIKVKLPSKARKSYDEMEKLMFTELKELFEDETHEVEAINAAAKSGKCRQIANGAIYTNTETKEWVEIHDIKIKALEEVIEEAAGMPVLVAYHYNHGLARLKKAFPQGRVLDKKPKTEKEWNRGEIPILFAHPASAGHGLSLQHGTNIIAFFEIDWNFEHHEQIMQRIGPVRQMQSGYDRGVFVYYILAENTVDNLIIKRHTTKESIQQILLNAMKHKEN